MVSKVGLGTGEPFAGALKILVKETDCRFAHRAAVTVSAGEDNSAHVAGGAEERPGLLHLFTSETHPVRWKLVIILCADEQHGFRSLDPSHVGTVADLERSRHMVQRQPLSGAISMLDM